ncbi:mono-functional DNA-alkylating methyl methanesulfonate N-term-domain-containing protein [Calycina marina]|uniref:Mono-functional DNA-alkylating methyl methanesulfonate N-term-domain-containing protein n=1 Tax=Calycina marina TaxID=1763456 RepID=A0A9P8CF52_9HELO|nr:mono-functional DNA-alkylating methyl methanesulfonate N-term-domain-containing protein [Calycina marina]
MAYLAPIHPPSSIRHALKMNLLDPEEECLVLAKTNRIEIWILGEERLVMLTSKAIYGRVSMLEKIRPVGATTDHLFIGTAQFQYCTVVWNPDTLQLDTVQSFYDVSEQHMQNSQSRDGCLVDPTGKVVVMELFQGILNIFKVIKPRKGTTDYFTTPEQVRITELRVKSCCFLHTEDKRPKLAILYDAGKQHTDIRLVTYRVVDEKGQISMFTPKDHENKLKDLDVGASMLIPVAKGEFEQKRYIVRNAIDARAHMGGLVVVGETSMLYLDDESKAEIHYTLEEPNIWVAWERYDDTQYLLADRYARLYLLTINVEGAEVISLDVRLIGKTTKAAVMRHMGNGVVFIGSHEGDTQVVRLNLALKKPTIEILQVMDNIAPILDFTVMDLGGRDNNTHFSEYSSGEARIVTGSGGWSEGSLRSVRSGVGLEDLGILADIDDIQGLFALSTDGINNDVLVVSLSIETRIFTFDGDEGIAEVDDFRGFDLTAHTLLAKRLANGYMLQVTTSKAILSPTQGKGKRSIWKPDPKYSPIVITSASANDDCLLISENGTLLAVLDLHCDLGNVASEKRSDQVACMFVPPQLPSIAIPNIAVVGYWKSGSIEILNLKDLSVLYREDLRRTDDTWIPRNIAFTQILHSSQAGPALFVAMEDGVVLAYNVDPQTLSLSGRKSIVLGTQQAKLEVLPRENGLYNVFAMCERPSLIYGSDGRVVYSAVTAEDAVHVCWFNSAVYPGSIVVATSDGQLKISQIDSERRTHVRTLPVGETVRRIAYSARERAFGIGTMGLKVLGNLETVQSTFRLVEEVLFGEIGEPFLLDASRGELIECVMRSELKTSYRDEPVERFIVGTSFLLGDDPADQKCKGRIIVFGVDKEKNPYEIMSHELKGACRCLSMMDGKIVAALVKTVVMYRYEETTETEAHFSKLATYRTSTNPISMDVHDNIIAVGDLMKSLSLVEYKPGVNGLPDELEEVARHMQALWSTAVVHIEGDTYLESDHHGNLVVLQRNRQGVTLEERMQLEATSMMNIGEVVNRIVHLNIAPSPTAIITPRAFMATTEGSIYLFSTIGTTFRELLMTLQKKLSSIVRTLGCDTSVDTPLEKFNAYRAFHIPQEDDDPDGPFRFVDGELIEHFLYLDEDLQEEVCRGLGPSVEDVRNMVEELKTLH